MIESNVLIIIKKMHLLRTVYIVSDLHQLPVDLSLGTGCGHFHKYDDRKHPSVQTRAGINTHAC